MHFFYTLNVDIMHRWTWPSSFLCFILEQIDMSLAGKVFKEFEPDDAHDTGDKGQAEIHGVHGSEVEKLLQKWHINHKPQE